MDGTGTLYTVRTADGWHYCGRCGGAPAFSRDGADAIPLTESDRDELLAEMGEHPVIGDLTALPVRETRRNSLKAA